MPAHEYQCTSYSNRFNIKSDYEGVTTTACPEGEQSARMVFIPSAAFSGCNNCFRPKNNPEYDTCEAA